MRPDKDILQNADAPNDVVILPLEIETELQALERLAWTMENLLPLPGTEVRLGLDSLLGIVPIVGDLLALLPAGYVIQRAAKLGVSRRVRIRMGLNVGFDLLIGVVPLIGDVVDVTWNASTRNVAILRTWLELQSASATPLPHPNSRNPAPPNLPLLTKETPPAE